MKHESRLVRFVTTISILLPVFAAKRIQGEAMSWGTVFVVAFIAFGIGRVVSRSLAKEQSRARKAFGWVLMFGSSAASAAYALDNGGGGVTALLDRVSAPADAGPPPPAPTRKLYEGPWKTVAITQDGLCTIDPGDDHVYCWGDPARGWPASSTGVSSRVAIDDVSTGKTFSCARASGGGVWCWRSADLAAKREPTEIALHDVVQLSVGDTHACAVDRSGAVDCWGEGDYGERGGVAERPDVPVRVAGVTGARSVAAGRHSSCVVLTSGEVWCWGAAPTEAEPTRISGAPERIEGVPFARSVALGDRTACAIDQGGQLYCWGAGPAASRVPARVAGFSDVAAVAIGTHHLCAALRSGHVRCTGQNDHGQLGTLDLRKVSFAVVPEVEGVGTVAAGDFATCALVRTPQNELVCWAMTRR